MNRWFKRFLLIVMLINGLPSICCASEPGLPIEIAQSVPVMGGAPVIPLILPQGVVPGSPVATTTPLGSFATSAGTIATNMAKGIASLAVGSVKLLTDMAQGASLLGEAAWEHPRIAAAAAVGSSVVAYTFFRSLYTNFNKECEQFSKEIQDKYLAFTANTTYNQASKSNKIMFWRNAPLAHDPLYAATNYWQNPQSITDNPQDVLLCLRRDRHATEHTWASIKGHLLTEIGVERAELSATCSKFARLLGSNNAFLIHLQDYLNRLDYKKISDDDSKRINAAIDSYARYSNWRYFYRRMSYTQECQLIKQYWQLQILLARLKAVEEVIRFDQ